MSPLGKKYRGRRRLCLMHGPDIEGSREAWRLSFVFYRKLHMPLHTWNILLYLLITMEAWVRIPGTFAELFHVVCIMSASVVSPYWVFIRDVHHRLGRRAGMFLRWSRQSWRVCEEGEEKAVAKSEEVFSVVAGQKDLWRDPCLGCQNDAAASLIWVCKSYFCLLWFEAVGVFLAALLNETVVHLLQEPLDGSGWDKHQNVSQGRLMRLG